MRKVLLLGALVIGGMASMAQTPIDHFYVGPYVVDYHGQGDVKYRLRDNVDLYDFFELQRDTTIISIHKEVPVESTIQLSAQIGFNPDRPKEFGIEGVWKKKLIGNVYFNGGLSLDLTHTDYGYLLKRNMLEIGVPLQIELGKLNHQYASLYGSVGLVPTVYTTVNTEKWSTIDASRADGVKKSGFLIAPVVEVGGNIPVGAMIMRIGFYGRYKVNCTPGGYDVYKMAAGRAFIGAKVGFVLK